jgi:hypothetical protein
VALKEAVANPRADEQKSDAGIDEQGERANDCEALTTKAQAM